MLALPRTWRQRWKGRSCGVLVLPVEDACDPFGVDVGVCFHVVSEPLGDVPEDAEREMVDDEREVVRGEGQVCAKLVDDGFNDVV